MLNKSRYFLVSQYRHQAYITVAKPDAGYIEYLTSEENVHMENLDDSDSLDKIPFLTLTHFGPFDIFQSKSMFALGRMVVTIAIQLSMDRLS